ncbi:uncharacterized protein LOC128917676 [Rissa tridactyla]|uniref:uncharacterized protein LOC128917676 n=1 Tax=Rissa tridactyla TaxID=75485 RepID=UPI0023BABE08|nr:uncharacterized protein LOC128917676 [Rissa tridactyla]
MRKGQDEEERPAHVHGWGQQDREGDSSQRHMGRGEHKRSPTARLVPGSTLYNSGEQHVHVNPSPRMAQGSDAAKVRKTLVAFQEWFLGVEGTRSRDASVLRHHSSLHPLGTQILPNQQPHFRSLSSMVHLRISPDPDQELSHHLAGDVAPWGRALGPEKKTGGGRTFHCESLGLVGLIQPPKLKLFPRDPNGADDAAVPQVAYELQLFRNTSFSGFPGSKMLPSAVCSVAGRESSLRPSLAGASLQCHTPGGGQGQVLRHRPGTRK